jgi:adenine-specific DNA-methyltransferase
MATSENTTENITIPNHDLEILKKHFSHCFDKNGKFDFEKFKTELESKEIEISKENYGMDWLGKSYARLLASDPATTLLKEDTDWNSKPENKNSQNLLLKGDNLEVLKHLSNSYHEQVKMIYIDPPYNTGSDGFVYADDRKFEIKEFAGLAGVDEEKAKKILSFVKSKSNSHSAWLTFMYPRLYIAKQLLKDDGVIFVSIDDNEVAQLRLLMDEIFGEENFVGQIVWHKKTQPSFLSKEISVVKEYILFYKKAFNTIYTLGGYTDPDKNIELLNISNSLSKRNFRKEYVVIENGKYSGTLRKGIYGNEPLQIELTDDLVVKDGKPFNDFVLKGRFKWGQEKIDESFSENDIFHIKSIKSLRPTIERNNKVTNIKPIIDILSKKFDPNIATNTDASSEIDSLFIKKEIFSNPKPSRLIKYLIKSITYNYLDSVVLDFFAGSGTTGDAVMQLNAEEGGNRRYILVQWPEAIDKKKNKTAFDFVVELQSTPPSKDGTPQEGNFTNLSHNSATQEGNFDTYTQEENFGESPTTKGNFEPTIFEITKERLVRAAKKIQLQQKEKNDKKVNQLEFEEKPKKEIPLVRGGTEGDGVFELPDFGFKIFETVPIWEDFEFVAEKLDPENELFNETKLTNEDLQTLLTTWKTFDGIPLSQDLQAIDLDGYIGYYGNKKLYLMSKGFETKNLKELLEKIDTDSSFQPSSIIVFGYNFDSKNLREIPENMSSYANKKQIEIDFVTRY